jgi:hypothetical protein
LGFQRFHYFYGPQASPNVFGERVVIDGVAGIFHLSARHKKVKTEPKAALFANWGDYRTTLPKYRMKP